MTDLTDFEKSLAARCLDMASDEFSNHGCNDFLLPDTPESHEFIAIMERWNYEDPEYEYVRATDGKGNVYTTDWRVMNYLAHRLREAGGDDD